MAVPSVYGDLSGYQTTRLAADGAVGGGPLVLEGVGIKSGATAGIVEWHEDADAATAAAKRGGLSGVVNGWEWVIGLHQNLTQAYFNLDANVTECLVIWRAG